MEVVLEVLVNKYPTPRLPYLDGAFEEISEYGSWRNDGILWTTTYDELMSVMPIYYPGYGISAAQIGPDELYVCIHATPYFMKMDVTQKIKSSIICYDNSAIVPQLESYDDDYDSDDYDSDDDIPPLVPDDSDIVSQYFEARNSRYYDLPPRPTDDLYNNPLAGLD
jgi:hypothetical protein